MIHQQNNVNFSASDGVVTVDDVAVLAMKIGAEIWGQEHFDMMMNPSDHPEESAPITGNASVSGKFTRNRSKEKPA